MKSRANQNFTDDPIFAAISTHRERTAAWERAIDVEFKLEGNIPAKRRCSWLGTTVKTDDPRWILSNRNQNRTRDALDDATWALLDCGPTTVGGAIALLSYVNEFRKGGRLWPDNEYGADEVENDWSYRINKNIVEALQRSGPQSDMATAA